MKSERKDGWVTRKYKTAQQAQQAWNDLRLNGANCCYSESGGNADGTGGEYELSFNKESYDENKRMKDL